MPYNPLFSGSDHPFNRPLRSFKGSPEQALISFDDHWEAFFGSLPNDEELARMDDCTLTDRLGADTDLFTTTIPNALREWRVSPSRSFINAIGPIARDLPLKGPIYANLDNQTRILAAGVQCGAISTGNARTIYGPDRKALRSYADAYAATLDHDQWGAFNTLLRHLKAWELRNQARVATGHVKIPKTLFRGIRGGTINIESPETVKDEPWSHWSCRVHMKQRDQLHNCPLEKVSGTSLLSFTSIRSVAEYFTKDQGFVVEVAPQDILVVSAWSLDESLDGKDPISGRHEREIIVRLKSDFTLKPGQISDHDRELAFSTRDPMGISMVYHRTCAEYELDGQKVEAVFHYNASGRGGKIHFRVADGWSETRHTLIKQRGFDPLPSNDRPAKKLRFYNRDEFKNEKRYYADFFTPKL